MVVADVVLTAAPVSLDRLRDELITEDSSGPDAQFDSRFTLHLARSHGTVTFEVSAKRFS